MKPSLIRLVGAVLIGLAVWLWMWPADFGGSTTYVAVSGRSMQPTYQPGDLVVAREQTTYSVGEIVVYRTDHGDVIHRIIGGDGENGYVMQGDNNPRSDQWTPTSDEVLGKAVLHIPNAGNTVMMVRQVLITPPFPYLLAGFVFLVIVLGDDPKKKASPRAYPNGDAVTDRLEPEHQPS